MAQIKKFKNIDDLISFFECGGEGIEEWLLKNEVINSTYSEEVILNRSRVIAVFDATRYFIDETGESIDDDEATDDCVWMVILKFKSLTTIDNEPIDIKCVKDLEKKNRIINKLGKLAEEITRQQLNVVDIKKLTYIVNELNEAINWSQSHINEA